jgi:AcrR family transcriptional regulator
VAGELKLMGSAPHERYQSARGDRRRARCEAGYAAGVSSAPAESPKTGRPRLHASGDERKLLFDAAFEAMKHNGYDGLTVGDVLSRSGLSTRSFYRHFQSKRDLLNAMFAHDATAFASALTARVQATETPAAAVKVWLEEILGFGLGRPRAGRAAVLGSASAMRAVTPEQLVGVRAMILAPLSTALAAGRSDGSFPAINDIQDAATISAIAWDASARLRGVTGKRAQQDVVDSTVRFVFRGLGTGA